MNWVIQMYMSLPSCGSQASLIYLVINLLNKICLETVELHGNRYGLIYLIHYYCIVPLATFWCQRERVHFSALYFVFGAAIRKQPQTFPNSNLIIRHFWRPNYLQLLKQITNYVPTKPNNLIKNKNFLIYLCRLATKSMPSSKSKDPLEFGLYFKSWIQLEWMGLLFKTALTKN